MQRHNAHWLLLVICVLLLGACDMPSLTNSVQQTQVSSAPTLQPTAANDLLAEVRRRGIVRIATDANYSPQSFQRIDGTWEGFDIEVGREIAKRLGVRAEFLDIPFNTVTAGGWHDRWDIHVGSMTITPARKQTLLFSEPYYYTPAVFAVHTRSTAQRIDDLRDTRVGVAESTTYCDYLNNKLTLEGEALLTPAPKTNIQVYETDQLALQDLAQGHIAAVLTALPTVHDAIKKGEPLKILSTPVYYEDLAVVLDRQSSRSSAALVDEISHIIEAMHQDTTLTRLSKQFYDVDTTIKIVK